MKNPTRVDRLAYKTIGLETIILDTKIGKEVHKLNEVATFVWLLCDGHHDVPMIIEKVCEEFEVDEQEANNDIHLLLTELYSKSLLIDNLEARD